MAMSIRVQVENIYELYEPVTTHMTAQVAPFPHGKDEDVVDEWWQEEIYPLTGTGNEDGNSSYFVTVVACDDPALVGAEREWC